MRYFPEAFMTSVLSEDDALNLGAGIRLGTVVESICDREMWEAHVEDMRTIHHTTVARPTVATMDRLLSKVLNLDRKRDANGRLEPLKYWTPTTLMPGRKVVHSNCLQRIVEAKLPSLAFNNYLLEVVDLLYAPDDVLTAAIEEADAKEAAWAELFEIKLKT